MLGYFLDERLKHILLELIDDLPYEDIGQIVAAMVYYLKYGNIDNSEVDDEIKPIYELLCYIVDMKRNMVKEEGKEGAKKQ